MGSVTNGGMTMANTAKPAESPEEQETALPDLEFPALFTAADEAAADHQQKYFNAIITEYVLLIAASFLALELSDNWLYYTLFVVVLAISAWVLYSRITNKPEQDWYRCRALAESVKTLTWKYVMRAEPFSEENPTAARQTFRSHLQELLRANQHIGSKIAGFDASGAQITESMDAIRRAGRIDRTKKYLDERIRDQRKWYGRKADWNNRRARLWSWISGAIYLAAVILVLARFKFPTIPLGLVSVFAVAASAALGWRQISKFTELASAYTLTAHEIGFVEGKIEDAQTEEELSDFVNEAELAFSREHTQWIARQTS